MAQGFAWVDPGQYFGFALCRFCRSTPCTFLRTGHIGLPRYVFVHRSEYGYADCPLSATSFAPVREYLESLNFHKLKFTFDWVHLMLTETERLVHHQDYL